MTKFINWKTKSDFSPKTVPKTLFNLDNEACVDCFLNSCIDIVKNSEIFAELLSI